MSSFGYLYYDDALDFFNFLPDSVRSDYSIVFREDSFGIFYWFVDCVFREVI